MKLGVTTSPRPGALVAAGRRELERVRRANQVAVDQATRKAHGRIRAEMAAAGLGRLQYAVKVKTSLRSGTRDPNFAWGSVFADRGDESRAGQALKAYSEGAIIVPRHGSWLAFPAPALARVTGFGKARARMTPRLYRQRGMDKTLGPLIFRRVSSSTAILFTTGVDVLRKTGRAVPRGKRLGRARTRPKFVTLFFLIRVTTRAKRFDQNRAMQFFSARVPQYIQAILAKSASR